MSDPTAGSEMAERYDQENDVYYFTFKTGEPSYCVEVNDVLLLEIGMFSHLPTGFRILNMSKSSTKRVTIDEAKKFLDDVLRNLSVPNRTDREVSVGRALEKVLA